MLAAITDYIFPWQLLVILGYMFIWLIGGYFLTLKSLARFPDLPRQKRSPAAAFTLNVVSTGLGLLGSLVLVCFVAALVKSWELYPYPYYIAAALLAPVAALLLSWAASLAMVSLPGKALWGIVLRTTGVMLLAGLVLVAAAAYPTYKQRQNNRHVQDCKMSMLEISVNMDRFVRTNPGKVPASLDVLVGDGMEERLTHCGGLSKNVKLVYLAPPKFGRGIDKTDVDRIVASDPNGAHSGRRVVMLADGQVQDMSEEAFQRLLAKPGNEAFVKLLGK